MLMGRSKVRRRITRPASKLAETNISATGGAGGAAGRGRPLRRRKSGIAGKSMVNYAACAAPPGMFVPTGALVGPACVRGLNHNAVNQTFDPGGVAAGKTISTLVR